MLSFGHADFSYYSQRNKTEKLLELIYYRQWPVVGEELHSGIWLTVNGVSRNCIYFNNVLQSHIMAI
jgi:hypothetical protein